MSDQQPLYYRLEPVYPSKPGGIATAAIVTCLATGKALRHCGGGGGGDALSVDVVQALDARQHGGRARVIVDAQDWDDLRAFLGIVIDSFGDGDLVGTSCAGDGVLTDAVRLRERIAP